MATAVLQEIFKSGLSQELINIIKLSVYTPPHVLNINICNAVEFIIFIPGFLVFEEIANEGGDVVSLPKSAS